MATRDGEGKASRTEAGKKGGAGDGEKRLARKAAPAKSAPLTAAHPKAAPASPAQSRTVGGAPRKPIQILRDKPTSRSFWVFCDDGSVWVARYKKGSLRWAEAGPPLPGSPEDRRGTLSTQRETAKETA